MPLTPDEVHKKTFTPVRLREGYDMGEVDHFLDEVEQELMRLGRENDELRAKVESAPTTLQGAGEGAAAAPVAEPPVLPAVTTVPEASSAAARLLEIATTNADQLVNEARADAERIVDAARTDAERLESESRGKAEQLESAARARAGQLDSETSERREQLLGQLEQDKDTVSRQLEDLRSFEHDFRSRLKAYFEAQLNALDGNGDGSVPLTPSQDDDTPPRLRELLGEDA